MKRSRDTNSPNGNNPKRFHHSNDEQSTSTSNARHPQPAPRIVAGHRHQWHRRRNNNPFLIRNMLDLPPSPPANVQPHSEQPKDYIEQIGETTSKFNKKYKLLQWDSNFQITDLPKDPEALVAGTFQFAVDRSIEEFRQRGFEPDLLGATISSVLLDNPIFTPIRPLTKNTTSVLLNQFDRVVQSKDAMNVNLYGEPFSIKICLLSRKDLPTERQMRGSGPPRRKRTIKNPVDHRIKKKALIQIDNPGDKYCLFYALMATMIHECKGLTRNQFYEYLNGLHGSRGVLQREGRDLMRAVGAPFEQEEYEGTVYIPRVIDYWNANPHLIGGFRLKVFVFKPNGFYDPIYEYGPDDYNKAIVLCFNDGHFNGIRTAHGIFNHPYCLDCKSPYHCRTDHAIECRSRCKNCARTGPGFPCAAVDGEKQKCQNCKKTFLSAQCYNHHIKSKFCEKSKKCEKCGVIWNVADNCRDGRQGHKCGETHCGKCNDWHDKKTGCWVKPLEPRKRKPYRILAFDMETTQHRPMDPKNPNNKRKRHVPNFIAAKVACPECIENGQWKESLLRNPCEVCGDHRTATFGHRPFNKTEVDYKEQTENVIEKFVDWLLELPEEYETFAFAHNGGRFDAMFICKELYKRRLNPEMIRNGNKLYQLKVNGREGEHAKLVIRDSLNLTNMPLAALVSAFNLQIKDKPFFPYLANNEANYGVRMPTLPPKEDYLCNGFTPEKREKFEGHYGDHFNDGFFLDEALPEYCCNDVEILMAALVALRAETMNITRRKKINGKVNRAASDKEHNGIDPLRESITIATNCMKHFRLNHLKKQHLGLVTDQGPDREEDTQSSLAIRFMQLYAEDNNVTIQTAHSAGGEKRVYCEGNRIYKLDGWIESEQLGIEVNGCVVHGCPHCFPDDNTVLLGGKTAGWLRERDHQRMELIKKVIPNVDIYWQCKIEEHLNKNKHLKEKFYNYPDTGPINIREAFYGGRTGPLKLFHKRGRGKKISYLDITSLYPYINMMIDPQFKNIGYPVGQPEVEVINSPVYWTRPEHNPFKLAILKVFVVPPRKIDVPVLPHKLEGDNRLLFPLCNACARNYPNGAVNEHYTCEHSEQKRGWVSLVTSVELDEALKEGYTVRKVFRVIRYEKSDNELFRGYMREFLAEKFHASGFDSSIEGDREAEDKFIKECWEKFGIKVHREKMKPDKGKRSLAKLCLNNLWGRFSLRNYGLSESIITDDPVTLRKYLDDRKIDITGIDILTDEEEDEENDEDSVMMISFVTKKEFVDTHECSNVVISLWTTSCARLILLRLMQKVARTPGCTLLYTDTDSIIFEHDENANPLADLITPHLGDLTDEFPHHEILEYVSGGAKQYALKLQKKGDQTADYEYTQKIRGITLSYDVMVNQGLRYETFKESVLNYVRNGYPDPIHLLYPNFLRPSIKNGVVESRPLTKIYKPYVGKGIVRPSDYRVLDFGYISQ